MGVPKLTIPDNVQAQANAVTSQSAEIDENCSLNEQRTGLKESIASASLKQLGKSKEKRKGWMLAETLNRSARVRDLRLYNSSNCHNLRCEATGSPK